MRRRLLTVFCGAIAIALVVIACGGGSGGGTSTPAPPTTPSPTPAPSPSPTPTTTITISGNAASPRSITVSPGSRVTFVNDDSRAHDMSSDPHPEHTDCPEIDQVGFLQPGQSRQTGNLNTVRTCGFHDHNQPGVAALTGTIRIQ